MDSAFITGAAVRVQDGGHEREHRQVAPLGNAVEHYHFLMETLPQVLRVRQVAPEAVFLTSEDPSPFARAMLDRLAVAYQVVERNRVLACSSLVYCEGFPRERTHPADMELLHDTLVSDPGGDPAAPTGRVYISRARSMRAVRDEHLLEEALRNRGFETLCFEDLSFAEQVACMSRAELVVAPHGAGLANTVFMPQGGRVIEVTSGEWWSNAFRRIAHARGHDYRLVTVPSGPDFRWGRATDVLQALTPVLDSLDPKPGRRGA